MLDIFISKNYAFSLCWYADQRAALMELLLMVAHLKALIMSFLIMDGNVRVIARVVLNST